MQGHCRSAKYRRRTCSPGNRPMPSIRTGRGEPRFWWRHHQHTGRRLRIAREFPPLQRVGLAAVSNRASGDIMISSVRGVSSRIMQETAMHGWRKGIKTISDCTSASVRTYLPLRVCRALFSARSTQVMMAALARAYRSDLPPSQWIMSARMIPTRIPASTSEGQWSPR